MVSKTKNLEKSSVVRIWTVAAESLHFFLQTPECQDLMKINRICIHLDTRKFIFDNENSGESIYDFFSVQQDYSKKIVENEIGIFGRL